jgi:hypothetical protein
MSESLRWVGGWGMDEIGDVSVGMLANERRSRVGGWGMYGG